MSGILQGTDAIRFGYHADNCMLISPLPGWRLTQLLPFSKGSGQRSDWQYRKIRLVRGHRLWRPALLRDPRRILWRRNEPRLAARRGRC